MEGYLVVFAVASLVTFGFTPVVRRIAFRVGALYQPSERTMHAKPMPTVGGAAMFVGFLVSMGVASQIPQFQQMFDGSSEPAGVMFAVGALDDLREVSPPAKVAGQVLSGSILSLMGVSMLFFRVPFFGVVVLSPDLAPLVTVLMVVLFANAINLVDGLDGLAAGIVAIAGMAVFLYSHRLFDEGFLTDSNIAPLVAMIAVGICIGFLPWNFSPAKIFMGDAGAMFLGLLMAVCTITLGGRADYEYSGQTFFFFAPLFIPLVILGVPLLDTAFSFFRRVLRRQSFSLADKDHLHHRLIRLGHGPRRTVVILWLWTALLSGLALLPLYTSEANAYVPVGILALALGLFAIFAPGNRKDAKLREGLEPPETGSSGESEKGGDVIDLTERRQGSG